MTSSSWQSGVMNGIPNPRLVGPIPTHFGGLAKSVIASALIGPNGYGDARASWESDYATYEMQIWAAYRYLFRFSPARKPFNATSYGLKHSAERWCDYYISNGALLIAAIVHGIRIVRVSSTSLNGLLYVREEGEQFVAAERRPIPNGLRARVLERDRFRCRRCGATSDEARLVIDHIVPVAQGGLNEFQNLQALCRPCNAGKRDRTPHPLDFRSVE